VSAVKQAIVLILKISFYEPPGSHPPQLIKIPALNQQNGDKNYLAPNPSPYQGEGLGVR
jgi:hypothetical protein